mmetsp:Transcript_25247/g.51287  ORF Transcript_25247/g.51287 Transcript_25247/m.51287 type:complete len:123 (-) Transcript_25247:166-534(-)
MSAKPAPESGAQKGAKVTFAPVTLAKAADEGEEEFDDEGYGIYEYSYPDLEHLCELNASFGNDEDEYAQVTGKLGPAAAAAQRAAGNAAAAQAVVDKGVGKAVGKARRKPQGPAAVSTAPSR